MARQGTSLAPAEHKRHQRRQKTAWRYINCDDAPPSGDCRDDGKRIGQVTVTKRIKIGAVTSYRLRRMTMSLPWCVEVAVILLGTSTIHPSSSETREYCQWETVNITCAPDQVIVMTAAKYGRMQPGRCVSKSYGSVGCSTSVLSYMDSTCSGRHECKFLVPDERLREVRPCPRDFAAYLEVSYKCIPVISGSDLPCYESEYLEVNAASGYLASVVTDRTGRGSVDCPWLIRAEPWQRINLTMWDFALNTGSASYSIPGSSGESAGVRDVTLIGTHCHKYAVIHEKLVIRETIVCGDLQREKVVYISTTNEVSVEMTRYNVPKKSSYFLLHFNTIGCQTILPPSQGWMERSGNDVMIVGCNVTKERWYLRCDGRRWIGDIRNCSLSVDAEEGIVGDWSSPFGILLVSACGVGLGLVIGSFLLSVLLFIIRRKQKTCFGIDPLFVVPSSQYGQIRTHTPPHHPPPIHKHPATCNGLSPADHLELVGFTAADPASYGTVWPSRPPSYASGSPVFGGYRRPPAPVRLQQGLDRPKRGFATLARTDSAPLPLKYFASSQRIAETNCDYD